MHMASRVFLMMSATLFISEGVAFAGSAVGINAAIHNCQNTGVAPEDRIQACTDLLHSNLATQGARGRLYYHRGVAYEAAHDFDRALKDYDEAVELAPQNAEAQAARAHLMEQHPANTPGEPQGGK